MGKKRWGGGSLFFMSSALLLCITADASIPNFKKWNDSKILDARVAIENKVCKITEMETYLENYVSKSNNDPNLQAILGYDLPIIFFAAADTTSPKNLESLLNNNTTVFPLETSLGWTVLHVAAINSKANVELILADGRTNVNEQNLKGDTALMLALQSGRYDIAETILKYKSNLDDGIKLDVSIANEKGETAISLIEMLDDKLPQKNQLLEALNACLDL